VSESAAHLVAEFRRRTVIPMMAVIFVSFALSMGFLYQVGTRQDERAIEQSTRLLNTAIDARRATLAKTLRDYAAWGEAYKNLHLDFSQAWAFDQQNAGATLFTDFGYNYVFVVDPEGKTVYSVVDGALSPASAEAALGGSVDKLVADARAVDADQTVVKRGGLQAGGDPVLVSAGALSTGNDPTVVARPGTPSVLIFGDRLTPEKLRHIGDQLAIADLAATSDPTEIAQVPAIALQLLGGKPMALRWTPDRPGEEQMRSVLPWSAVAALMLAAFVVLVLRYAARSAGIIAETTTQLAEAHARAHYQAEHDAATGLPNRLRLLNFIDDALADPTARLVLLYADLDRFKTINDALGHPIGDVVLVAVAKRLQGAIREQDMVARFGGDEFVIAARGLADHDIESLCQRLVRDISAPIHYDGGEVNVGLSIGIATAPTDATGTNELLRCADLALYQAKSDGGGTYRFFAEEMNKRILERRLLEADLRRGLERHEFRLMYQPRFDTETMQIRSVEALVRWQHPERGLIAPDQFIRIAEETGLIIPLGEWVLRTACSTVGALPGIGVSVNVSPVQFRNAELSTMVERALAETGFPPFRLELELTEGVLLEDTAKAQATLAALKALGVRLSMDDFGTGYSSLGYLRRFPFDGIKIDKQFIADLGSEGDARTIVQAIVSLGKALGMTVTAEGVETAEQLKLLRHNACEEVQGFYMSRPVPADALGVLVAKAAAEKPAQPE
jgi:diguanylate cyclase (GGDEF)-like protein